MAPYFVVGHPIATVLIDGTAAAWAASELRQALKRRSEATTRERSSRLVNVLCMVGAMVQAELARRTVTAAAFSRDAGIFGVGVTTLWVGVALRWWSFHTLGRFFTVDVMTSPDQPVITTGPYRIVRHPSYTGLLLIFAGIGIIDANWLSLAVMILLPLLGLLNRIHVEEVALAETLGDAYSSYATRHKRIIPFVW